MIKANELRIGNIIYTTVFGGHTLFEVLQRDFKKDFTDFEPIPLTEEWLLKFGFNQPNVPQKEFIYEFLRICQNTNDQFVETELFYTADPDIPNWLEIKYVHQLQNLYFALTGEELTIHD